MIKWPIFVLLVAMGQVAARIMAPNNNAKDLMIIFFFMTNAPFSGLADGCQFALTNGSRP
jgi:hypothetical protein